MKCKAQRADGLPCKSSFIDETGLCKAHGGSPTPRPQPEKPKKCVGQGHFGRCHKHAGDDGVCDEHRDLLNPESVMARVKRAEAQVAKSQSERERAHTEALLADNEARKALKKLADLRSEIAAETKRLNLLTSKARDCELLTEAERASERRDATRAEFLLNLVKERRQQRRENAWTRPSGTTKRSVVDDEEDDSRFT